MLRKLAMAAGVAAGLIYGGTTGAAAGEDNAEAAQLVKAMTDYLQTLEAFSVKVDVGTDVVLKTGQKHKLNSSGEVLVRRPGALRVTRKGELADAEFNFDGKTLSILSRSDNVYFQADAPGTIDDLVDALQNLYGIDLPAADLFGTRAYEQLMTGAWSVTYYGQASIDGVACDHIGVRADSVDWQIWIRAGDKPLPCQYVVTSKWMSGAPEHQVRFYGWNEAPEIAADSFVFTPPADAKKAETAPADEITRLTNGE